MPMHNVEKNTLEQNSWPNSNMNNLKMYQLLKLNMYSICKELKYMELGCELSFFPQPEPYEM